MSRGDATGVHDGVVARLAEGAGRVVGAGLVALRAVVGQPVDILLAGLEDRCAGIETGHILQESIREVLDHEGNASALSYLRHDSDCSVAT